MAFGDSGSVGADDGATVKLHVDTSETARLEIAEREWRESVGAMSREALKLDLATDRLKKSLTNYGAESAQAKRATIALKDAEEAAARAADRQTRETQQLAAAQNRQRAGIGGLTKGVVGLASAYVGAYGLLAGIRSVLAAAREEELVRGQTKVALEALGVSYDEHVTKIERATRATSQLGFDDEDLLKSFQMLVRGTKDVDVALERVALAADVARGRYIDLDAATQIVNKAQLGMGGALRRLGIDAEKGASGVELITLLQKNYGRAAEEAADTGVAALDRLNVEWENMKEVVGSGLLPSVTELSDRLADYFGDAQNQAEVQRRVNDAIEDGETVVRGFAGAIRTVAPLVKGASNALGGFDNLLTTIFVVGMVTKVAKGATALLSLIAAARAARIGVTREMALMSAAIDAATRPRVLPIAGVPGGGPAGGGGRGLVPFLGLNPATAIIAAAGITAYFGIKSGRKAAIDDTEMSKLLQAVRQGRLTGSDLEEARKFLSDEQYRALRQAVLNRGRTQSGQQTPPRGEGRPTQPPRAAGDSGGRRDRDRPPSLMDLDLALSREEARGGDTSDELRAIRDHHAREIRRLEAIENLTKEQKEKLRSHYGAIAAAQSRLDDLQEAEEQKLREQRARAEEKREQERERREAAIRKGIERREGRLTLAEELAEDTKKDLLDNKRALIDLRRFYGQQAGNDKLALEERQAFADKRRDVRRRLQALREQAIQEAVEDEKVTERERRRLRRLGGSALVRQAERELRRGGEDEDRLTRADVNRIISSFLDEFNRFQRDYRDNFDRTYDRAQQAELIHINRQQAYMQSQLVGGTQAQEHFQAKAFAGAGFDGM